MRPLIELEPPRQRPRGQPEDYDRWAALGNEGWGWRDVLPHFIRSEHNSRGASEFHGGDGPQW